MEKLKQDNKNLIDVNSLDDFVSNEDAKIFVMMFMVILVVDVNHLIYVMYG